MHKGQIPSSSQSPSSQSLYPQLNTNFSSSPENDQHRPVLCVTPINTHTNQSRTFIQLPPRKSTPNHHNSSKNGTNENITTTTTSTSSSSPSISHSPQFLHHAIDNNTKSNQQSYGVVSTSYTNDTNQNLSTNSTSFFQPPTNQSNSIPTQHTISSQSFHSRDTNQIDSNDYNNNVSNNHNNNNNINSSINSQQSNNNINSNTNNNTNNAINNRLQPTRIIRPTQTSATTPPTTPKVLKPSANVDGMSPRSTIRVISSPRPTSSNPSIQLQQFQSKASSLSKPQHCSLTPHSSQSIVPNEFLEPEELWPQFGSLSIEPNYQQKLLALKQQPILPSAPTPLSTSSRYSQNTHNSSNNSQYQQQPFTSIRHSSPLAPFAPRSQLDSKYSYSPSPSASLGSNPNIPSSASSLSRPPSTTNSCSIEGDNSNSNPNNNSFNNNSPYGNNNSFNSYNSLYNNSSSDSIEDDDINAHFQQSALRDVLQQSPLFKTNSLSMYPNNNNNNQYDQHQQSPSPYSQYQPMQPMQQQQHLHHQQHNNIRNNSSDDSNHSSSSPLDVQFPQSDFTPYQNQNIRQVTPNYNNHSFTPRSQTQQYRNLSSNTPQQSNYTISQPQSDPYQYDAPASFGASPVTNTQSLYIRNTSYDQNNNNNQSQSQQQQQQPINGSTNPHQLPSHHHLVMTQQKSLQNVIPNNDSNENIVGNDGLPILSQHLSDQKYYSPNSSGQYQQHQRNENGTNQSNNNNNNNTNDNGNMYSNPTIAAGPFQPQKYYTSQNHTSQQLSSQPPPLLQSPQQQLLQLQERQRFQQQQQQQQQQQLVQLTQQFQSPFSPNGTKRSLYQYQSQPQNPYHTYNSPQSQTSPALGFSPLLQTSTITTTTSPIQGSQDFSQISSPKPNLERLSAISQETREHQSTISKTQRLNMDSTRSVNSHTPSLITSDHNDQGASDYDANYFQQRVYQNMVGNNGNNNNKNNNNHDDEDDDLHFDGPASSPLTANVTFNRNKQSQQQVQQTQQQHNVYSHAQYHNLPMASVSANTSPVQNYSNNNSIQHQPAQFVSPFQPRRTLSTANQADDPNNNSPTNSNDNNSNNQQ